MAVADRMPLLKVVQLYRSRETAVTVQPQSPEMDRQDGSAASWRTAGPQQQTIRPASAPLVSIPSRKWRDSSV